VGLLIPEGGGGGYCWFAWKISKGTGPDGLVFSENEAIELVLYCSTESFTRKMLYDIGLRGTLSTQYPSFVFALRCSSTSTVN
jgi:hypothetical protein